MADVRRLPVPVAEIWDWQLELACRVCPVLAHCRAHALRMDGPYEVWGGMSVDERREVLDGHRSQTS